VFGVLGATCWALGLVIAQALANSINDGGVCRGVHGVPASAGAVTEVMVELHQAGLWRVCVAGVVSCSIDGSKAGAASAVMCA
jgi:hypothetical protein